MRIPVDLSAMIWGLIDKLFQKTKTELPVGFPVDFPTPRRAHLAWSFSEQNEGKQFFWARYICNEVWWEVERDMRRRLSQAHWSWSPSKSGMKFTKDNFEGVIHTYEGRIVVQLWCDVRQV